MPLPVLVVDDCALARKSLIRCLPAALQANVTQAQDGAEALRLFDQCPPALLFLDLDMPGVNGYQVLRELGQRAHSTCIIIVSGDVWGGLWPQLQQMGARAVLAKPWSQSELHQLLSQLGFAPARLAESPSRP